METGASEPSCGGELYSETSLGMKTLMRYPTVIDKGMWYAVCANFEDRR